MVINKSAFLVLIFSLLLSFGLFCSGSSARGRRTEQDPRQQYEQCQRRCQWETRGEREQEQCEQSCERQYKEQQQGQQEEGGRRSHDMNPEDPQKKYEECQQRCEQQEYRQRPQCQLRCQRQFEKQQRQQQQCQERCERQEQGQQEQQQCQRKCKQQSEEQQRQQQCQEHCERQEKGQQEQQQCQRKCQQQSEEQQEERGRRSHDMNPEDPQKKYEECQQRCEQQEYRQRPQCQLRCQRQFEKQQRQQQQCQEHCERQEQGQQEQQQCQRKCHQQSEEQQREQKEQPQKQYQECQERCQEQQQEQEEQQKCQRKCREQYEEQERDKDEDNHHHKQSRREGEEQEEEQQRNNPYYFPYRRSFQTRLGDEEGKFKLLQRFAEKSPLLKGIKNYRLAMLEANPNTFVLPFHCNSEAIYVVTNGKGTITFVTHENKESYNIERGTVVRNPAGSTAYMVNQDNKEKLTIAVLELSVNTTGKSQAFYPAGNGNPQSYYQTFSSEILETVLNTPREKLEKLFEGQRGQQKQKRQQGGFRRAKPEQIRAMSQQATSPRKRGGEILAINLLSQSPVYSNQNGRFFEASPEEFQQLQNMDVAVAASKINQGAIFVPHYNSKATFVVLVTEGNGYIEMVCPHLSRQIQGSRSGRQDSREQEEEEEEEEEEERSVEYKVKARLSPGDVFVIPAGHPFTFVASRNENLKTIGFGIHAQNNQRIFLAGKKNLMRQMDSEAKEISFGVPSKLVDEIFNKPEESYFMSSSQQKQRGSEDRRGNPLASFLDFARLF